MNKKKLKPSDIFLVIFLVCAVLAITILGGVFLVSILPEISDYFASSNTPFWVKITGILFLVAIASLVLLPISEYLERKREEDGL